MTERRIILHQFQYSHFNEKARWALDWKGIAHERENYLPGPHMLLVRRLSGQTATPVLQIGDDIVPGSARIIAELERHYPSPSLYPDDPEARRRALEIEAHFDAVVGPAVRTAIFSVFLDHPDYVCGTFGEGKPALALWLYRATFPLAKPLIAAANGVSDPANVARSFEITSETLDWVSANIGPSGYLVGDRFTVADLTCAALLAVLCRPAHPDMARPGPTPKPVEDLLARWADHPAIAWVCERYARDRPLGR